MASTVIFFTFLAIFTVVVSGAFGMLVMGEKGKSTLKGFIIGALVPIFGPIMLYLFAEKTDKVIIDDMYERKYIDFNEYQEKTREMKINTQELKLKK